LGLLPGVTEIVRASRVTVWVAAAAAAHATFCRKGHHTRHQNIVDQQTILDKFFY